MRNRIIKKDYLPNYRASQFRILLMAQNHSAFKDTSHQELIHMVWHETDKVFYWIFHREFLKAVMD